MEPDHLESGTDGQFPTYLLIWSGLGFVQSREEQKRLQKARGKKGSVTKIIGSGEKAGFQFTLRKGMRGVRQPKQLVWKTREESARQRQSRSGTTPKMMRKGEREELEEAGEDFAMDRYREPIWTAGLQSVVLPWITPWGKAGDGSGSDGKDRLAIQARQMEGREEIIHKVKAIPRPDSTETPNWLSCELASNASLMRGSGLSKPRQTSVLDSSSRPSLARYLAITAPTESMATAAA
ncbi:hypothetical protein QBC35DRAFT_471279 [Podospora australis]|uniref:Uncharacterized protein n=1 Tax=Podospora australis TaxID=1536484 RepID=A0AAN6X078_9PEZI|nr:hypothetical protein QBC35DRAFT_471279 [Podospora australis]